MRKSSEFFGKWGSIELSDENNFEIYVPEGFAHGFLALSDEVLFYYKCTKEYSLQSERGVRWNDESLAIDWNIQDPIMYERDRNLPLFKDAEYFK
jgi:dTDP-4-dehydrorhamnose 3,5-epimerase